MVGDKADPRVRAALGGMVCRVKHTYDLGRRQGPGIDPWTKSKWHGCAHAEVDSQEVVVSERAVITLLNLPSC